MKFWTTLILIACLSLWRCSTVQAVRNRAAEQISREMTETGKLQTLRDEMPVSIRSGDFGDGHRASEGNDPRLIPAGLCVGFSPSVIRQE